jgi:hypothetical protein
MIGILRPVVYGLMGQLALVIWLSTFVLAVVVRRPAARGSGRVVAMRCGMAVSLAGMLVRV